MVRVSGAGPPIPIRLRGVRYIRFDTGTLRAEVRESGSSLGNPEGSIHDLGQTTAQGVVLSSLKRVANASCSSEFGLGQSNAERIAARCSDLMKGFADHK